jgi:hypothetical protein
MGGANGSRECAPDDKLRDTHQLHSVEVMGFAGLNLSTRSTRSTRSPDAAQRAALAAWCAADPGSNVRVST